ncbi:MAG: hypothetical protein ABW250_05915 [Pyrinomonadaceae bacterium]
MEELYRELALLTDEEAKLCLNGLLKGLTIRNEDYERLLKSSDEMVELIKADAQAQAAVAERLLGVEPRQEVTVVRAILVELAADKELGPKLKDLLEGARPTLLDPITISLVLGGIVLVLSTNAEIKYENENGKRKFKFHLKRKGSTEKLLGKFFSIFK